MEITRIICDRCGYEQTGGGFNQDGIRAILRNPTVSVVHLCKRCRLDFIAWMRAPRSEDKPKADKENER